MEAQFARSCLAQNCWIAIDQSTCKVLCNIDPTGQHSQRLQAIFTEHQSVKECLQPIVAELPAQAMRETLLNQLLAKNIQNIRRLAEVAQYNKMIRLIDKYVLAETLDANSNTPTQKEFKPFVFGECAGDQASTNQDDAAWIGEYPHELQSHLQRLQLVSGSAAKKWASKKLKADCPQCATTLRELHGIEQLMNCEQLSPKRAQCLAIRRANLHARLSVMRPISPRRMTNLMAKIEANIFEHTVRKLKSERITALRAKFLMIGIRDIPKQLFQSPYTEILPAILELEQPIRSVGLKVLAKGIQGPELFLDEPENRRYVERVTRLGVDLRAWLQPTTTVEATRKDGTRYRVAFATSSLEIFLMGYHFQTCLSPDNINFYSTIGNVADVNKRVIFGRTNDGTVVGRCLVCLNERGQIQAFHRYSHDAEDKFDEAIDQFLLRLARAMNSSLTSRGKIARLVVRQWYDDGCREVPIEPVTSIFETIVAPIMQHAPIDAAMNLVQDQLGSRQSVIAHLNEIVDFVYTQRRQLARHCLEWLGSESSHKTLTCRLILAGLVRDQGHCEMASEALASVVLNTAIRLLSRQQIANLLARPSVLSMLVESQPALTLRLLRLTRDRSIRSDLEEVDGHRRQSLHLINQKLFRHKRALTLK